MEVCRDLSSMTKRRLLKGAEGGKILSVCQVFSCLTHYLGKCAIHIFESVVRKNSKSTLLYAVNFHLGLVLMDVCESQPFSPSPL